MMAIRVPVELFQHVGSELVSGPEVEVVDVEQMRNHLRIEDEIDHDSLIEAIAEAREEIEYQTGMALINQTWRMSIDRWPSEKSKWWDGVRQGAIGDLYGPESASHLSLPKYPLLAVNSVATYDDQNNETLLDIDTFFNIDDISRPGRLTLKAGSSWPTALRSTNAIVIEYQAGYGASPLDVPNPLKRAVKVLAAYLFTHRGDGCDMQDALRESGAASVINRYRTQRI